MTRSPAGAGRLDLGSAGRWIAPVLSIVGLLLVAFVIIAPNGIVGLVQGWTRGRAK